LAPSRRAFIEHKTIGWCEIDEADEAPPRRREAEKLRDASDDSCTTDADATPVGLKLFCCGDLRRRDHAVSAPARAPDCRNFGRWEGFDTRRPVAETQLECVDRQARIPRAGKIVGEKTRTRFLADFLETCSACAVRRRAAMAVAARVGLR